MAKTNATTKPYGPAKASDGIIDGIRYVMTASEIKADYSVNYADIVFRADITRVDGLSVTRHTVYMAVDNACRCCWLAQDKDQPHATHLRKAAMRGYIERLADAPM